MSEKFHNYDPGKVIFGWGLLTGILTGYAENEFIKARRLEKSFKIKGGADGETTRIQNRNRQGEIVQTFKQGSFANAVLSAIIAVDENLGTGVAPCSLTDMSGSAPVTVIAAANCWIAGYPDVGFSMDEETRIWTFNTDTLEIFVGGN